jgi:hypothetical protein
MLTPRLGTVSQQSPPQNTRDGAFGWTKRKREGEPLIDRSHVSVTMERNLEAFIWVPLLEWKHKFGPTKMGVGTQIENGGPDLGATAGVALSGH